MVLCLQGVKGFSGETGTKGDLGELVRVAWVFNVIEKREAYSFSLVSVLCLLNLTWDIFLSMFKGYQGEGGPQGDQGIKGEKVRFSFVYWIYNE